MVKCCLLVMNESHRMTHQQFLIIMRVQVWCVSASIHSHATFQRDDLGLDSDLTVADHSNGIVARLDSISYLIATVCVGRSTTAHLGRYHLLHNTILGKIGTKVRLNCIQSRLSHESAPWCSPDTVLCGFPELQLASNINLLFFSCN